MQLYSGLSTDFIRDSVHNRIAEKVKDAFFRQFRFNPAPAEVNSWRNSLRAVSQVIDDAKLHDHGILLEYPLPINGKRVGGAERVVLHPSAQVGQYQSYLEDSHPRLIPGEPTGSFRSC